MGQLTITEMFSSQLARQRGRQSGLHSNSGVSPPQASPPRHRSRFEGQANSPLRRHFASPASASIPATPESQLCSSQRQRAAAADEHDVYVVPETPPQLILGNRFEWSGSLGQYNGIPEPPPAKGDSPLNALDISSGVDSDCEITMVRPSPNTNTNKQTRRLAQAKAKRNRPAVRQPTLPSKSGAARASQSRPVTPKPAPAQRRPAIKAAILQQIAPAVSEDDSDCIIEKVQPSPKRRLSSSTQQQPAKKQRVDDTDETDETDEASPTPIPFALAGKKSLKATPASTPTYSESDADGEDSEYETPCKARGTPRETVKQFEGRPAPVASLKIESPIVDLTDLASSSDSDMSLDKDAPQFKPAARSQTQTIRPAKTKTHTIARDAFAKSIKRELASDESDESDENDEQQLFTAPKLPFAAQTSGIPHIERDGPAHAFSSAPRYPTSNEHQHSIESSPPELPVSRLFRSQACLFTPPTSSLTSDPNDDSSNEKSIGRVASPDLGSSPISYHSTSEEEDDEDKDVPPRSPIPLDVYNFPRIGSGGYEPSPPPISRISYTLRPIYKGEHLLRMHKMGLSGLFKPHHRNNLIGLKGILKKSTGGRVEKKGVGFPSAAPASLMEQLRMTNWPRLFSQKKKSLDEIVEESLRQESLRQESNDTEI